MLSITRHWFSKCWRFAPLLPSLTLLILPSVGRAQDAARDGAQDVARDAWFPEVAHFSRPNASVREPTFAVGSVWSTVFRSRANPAERQPFDIGGERLETTPQADVALGGNVRIWQPKQWVDGGLTVGLQAGVFGRFRLDVSSADLIASDWIVAFPVEIARGVWSGRLRLQHWSAHVGDELIEAGVERIDFTTETVEALLAYEPGDFRIYGGGSLVVRSSLENEVPLGPTFSDDGLIRFGVDASVHPWTRDEVSLEAGLDWQSSDRTEWASQLSVRIGLVVRDGHRSARLSGIYRNGPSPMGQFFLTDERYFGIELNLGL